MIVESEGRLFNSTGEIVAEGSFQIDLERGAITLHTLVESPIIERQHGMMRLELEDGAEYAVTDRVIRFRLNISGSPPGPAYRLFMAGQTQETAQGGAK